MKIPYVGSGLESTWCGNLPLHYDLISDSLVTLVIVWNTNGNGIYLFV